MVVVIDTVSDKPLRPRHPEKAHRPDALSPPKPDWIRVRAPNTRGYAETAQHRARQRPRHGVRGGRLPEHRRVLGQEARHLHDHGRHLHARLRLLQRQDRHARRARRRPSRSTSREAVAKLGLAHVVITSVDRDDLADGGAEHFAADDPRHPRALPGDDDRDPDAGFPAQGRRARSRRRGEARRVQPQSRNRAVALSDGAARARAISIRSGCCSG